MSRAPPGGGSEHMPFGCMGLPGANPRGPPSQGQRADPRQYGDPKQGYGQQGYGQPQSQYGGGGSQGYGDTRISQGGGGGRPGYSEKGPSGGGKQVPLRVEKVPDKSLQSRLIYGNM